MGFTTIKLVSVGAMILFAAVTVGPLGIAAQTRSLPLDVKVRIARPSPVEIARRRKDEFGRPSLREWRKPIDGIDAEAGQFPWQVALIRSQALENSLVEDHFCGGTLIDWLWVLTAAHCTFGEFGALTVQDIHVYVGSHNFTGGQRINVKSIVRHESYDRYQDAPPSDHDLALLELISEPSDKSGLKLLRLATNAEQEAWQSGRLATVIGWGSTLQGRLPSESTARKSIETLRFAEVSFKRSDLCDNNLRKGERAYLRQLLSDKGWSEDAIKAEEEAQYPNNKQLISKNVICAGPSKNSEDACFGDSGGPLVVRWGTSVIQVGVVSWGARDGCGLGDIYGVYVLLPVYRDWIASKVPLISSN